MPDTKLLQVIEEEQCKDAMGCERLTELLFKLSAKEENYRELMLLIETEEEIPIKNWIRNWLNPENTFHCTLCTRDQ